MSIISQNIKLLRQVLGDGQREFANRFGLVNYQTIAAYEQGRAKPKSEFVAALCTHFGLSIDQLMKEKLTRASINAKTDADGLSVTEVKLRAQAREIELLNKAIADKEYIIELQKKLLNT